MLTKLARLLLVLLVIIVIAYQWRSGQVRDNRVPMVEPIIETPSSSSSPRPEFKIDLKPDPKTAEPKSDTNVLPIEVAPAGVFVQGVVKNQLGQGISDMPIEISPKNAQSNTKNTYTTVTDHRGTFQLDLVPPSDHYRLEVLASGFYLGKLVDPFPVNSGMAPAVVTLDSVDLVSVDGMIVDVNNAPVSDFKFLIQNVGIAYPGRTITSDTSGFFHLNQFPAGEVQLATNGIEHFKISGITLAPDIYRNLTLMLDKGEYHLSGWVSDEFGAPISQARVALTSDFYHEDYHSSSHRLKVSDSNGGFEFTGLGGQEHLLSIDAIGFEALEVNYQFQSYSDDLKIELQRK